MAEWCQLPKELLQLISERLDDSPIYLLRFRSVCSTWRSSIPKPHYLRHLPFKFPLFPDNYNNDSEYDNASTFFLSQRTIFLITPPPPQQHQQTLPLPLRPWLIEIDQDSRGRTHLWHPLKRDSRLPFRFPHVLDFNQLRVFHLGHVFFLAYPPSMSINSFRRHKVAAATWQANKEGFGFVLLTMHDSGKLALFHCGDERWTAIPDMPMPYSDVCTFKGLPYAVDDTGRTVTVEPDLSVDLVAEPVFGGDEKLLVESEGELLLVDKYLYFDKYELWKKVVRLDVYRLEEQEKRWVQLTTLGDRILFLGDACAFSASASDLCVGEGNCVIFRDRDGYGIRVFHLDDGRFSHLYDDDPGYFKLFWPPPDWVELH